MLLHTQISVSDLDALIGTPRAPVIIDVCINDDFEADPRLIPGSFRYPFKMVEALVPKLRDREVIVVCQKGLKLSQGVMSIFRCANITARYLAGGIFAWRDAGKPLVPAAKIPPCISDNTLWVTGVRPGLDCLACVWLIRRFIDPEARFMFVEPAAVEMVGEKFGAIPFDIEGVFWSPRDKRCTFDIMIEEFDLTTEPLLRLATIIRGADINHHQQAPQSAGLLAAALGLSTMYKDDLEQLNAGLTLFDAFYHWSKDVPDRNHVGTLSDGVPQ